MKIQNSVKFVSDFEIIKECIYSFTFISPKCPIYSFPALFQYHVFFFAIIE